MALSGLQAFLGGAVVGGLENVEDRVREDRKFDREKWLLERKAQIDQMRLQQTHNFSLQQIDHQGQTNRDNHLFELEANRDDALIKFENMSEIQQEQFEHFSEQADELGLKGQDKMGHIYRMMDKSMTGFGSGKGGTGPAKGTPLDPVNIVPMMVESAEADIRTVFADNPDKQEQLLGALNEAFLPAMKAGKFAKHDYGKFMRLAEVSEYDATRITDSLAVLIAMEIAKVDDPSKIPSNVLEMVRQQLGGGGSQSITSGSQVPSGMVEGEMTPEQRILMEERQKAIMSYDGFGNY